MVAAVAVEAAATVHSECVFEWPTCRCNVFVHCVKTVFVLFKYWFPCQQSWVQTRLWYCYSYANIIFCKHSLQHFLIGLLKSRTANSWGKRGKAGHLGRDRNHGKNCIAKRKSVWYTWYKIALRSNIYYRRRENPWLGMQTGAFKWPSTRNYDNLRTPTTGASWVTGKFLQTNERVSHSLVYETVRHGNM